MNEWDARSFEFPLDPSSVVIELGGFNGRWCGEIHRRHAPRLFVYEPQGWAYEGLVARFANAPNVRVFRYGLGTATAYNLPLGEFGTDGCSFLPAGREQGRGDMMEWYGELDARGIARIDLLLMNIEGYEFALLTHILPMFHRIHYFMVQFHCDRTDPASVAHYRTLRERMAITHDVLWDYETVLSCWKARVW